MDQLKEMFYLKGLERAGRRHHCFLYGRSRALGGRHDEALPASSSQKVSCYYLGEMEEPGDHSHDRRVSVTTAEAHDATGII